MLNKRLAVTFALMAAIAVPSAVLGAGPAKPTDQKKNPAAAKPPTVAKPAPTAAPAAPAAGKPTQEANLKRFKTAPDSTVVATVNGESITKGRLVNHLWDWMAPLALDEYINYRIVAQAAKREGIQVSEADVDKKIEEIKQQQLPAGDTLESFLQRIKWSLVRFRAYVTSQVSIEKIANKRIQPKDSDYAQYILARHILIRSFGSGLTRSTDPNEQAKAEAEAKTKIDKIAEEIKGGKKFEEAAKEYSEDPGTKETGGLLKWFKKEDMVAEFSDAAFKLEPGQMGEPVKTPYGYHLIFVEKLGKNASRADKVEIANLIREKERPRIMRTLMEDLRKGAKLDNKISPQLPEPQRPGLSGEEPPARTPRESAPKTVAPRSPAPKPTTPGTTAPKTGGAGGANKTAPPPAPPKPAETTR